MGMLLFGESRHAMFSVESRLTKAYGDESVQYCECVVKGASMALGGMQMLAALS